VTASERHLHQEEDCAVAWWEEEMEQVKGARRPCTAITHALDTAGFGIERRWEPPPLARLVGGYMPRGTSVSRSPRGVASFVAASQRTAVVSETGDQPKTTANPYEAPGCQETNHPC
jgi:hypothetical protein